MKPARVNKKFTGNVTQTVKTILKGDEVKLDIKE